MTADIRHLLVDGNNLLSRAINTPTKAMSAHGVNTTALVLFVGMLSKYVRLVEPTHVTVFWDRGYHFRTETYPEYKANRNQTRNAEDVGDYDRAKRFLTWANVPHMSRPGWEADDLMAVSVRTLEGQKILLSSDKDLLQLLGPDTIQYRPPDDEAWTAERFEDEYGYPPHQYPLVKALMGDTGDNVPGLPRVGPKKAVKMLEEGSWDWLVVMETLSDEDATLANVCRDLVDLRHLDYGARGLHQVATRPFEPTGPGDMLWGALEGFLADMEMSTVRARIEAGTLWSSPDAEDLQRQREESLAAFEGIES